MSEGAGGDAVLIRSYATDFSLGQVNVHNTGQISASASKTAVNMAGGRGTIDNVIALDDQSTPTMHYGINLTNASAVLDVKKSRITGATVAATSATTGASLNLNTSGTSAPTNNYVATSDPLVTSDSSAGYSVGSQWVNTTTNTLYLCVNAAASAAVWKRTNANIQVFTATGTWTKPTGCSTATVSGIAPGGGGGSGRRTASGTAASGGAGGGGGGYMFGVFNASELSSSVGVTVNAAGTGAASVTTDSTNGNAGGTGGAIQFGTYLRAQPGTGGAAGTTASTSSSGGGNGTANGGSGAGGTIGALSGNGGTGAQGAPGGAAGGGLATSPAFLVGGVGGLAQQNNFATGGTGGASDGAAGVAGTNAFDLNLATAGSGGGGGCSLNGYSSGAGGAGGPGIVVVIAQ